MVQRSHLDFDFMREILFLLRSGVLLQVLFAELGLLARIRRIAYS
jgi:hypothetical protein